MQNGLTIRPKPSRLKRLNVIRKNYDKQSKAVTLKIGDMVLVCVTSFKDCHKIQDRWENREYVFGKVALSQCTSLCGTPQGWGRVQLDPM